MNLFRWVDLMQIRKPLIQFLWLSISSISNHFY